MIIFGVLYFIFVQFSHMFNDGSIMIFSRDYYYITCIKLSFKSFEIYVSLSKIRYTCATLIRKAVFGLYIKNKNVIAADK